MKNMKLFRAIGEVDSRYVEEAARPVRKMVWIPIVAAAACVALTVGLWQGGMFDPHQLPVEGTVAGTTTTEADAPTDTTETTEPTDEPTTEPMEKPSSAVPTKTEPTQIPSVMVPPKTEPIKTEKPTDTTADTTDPQHPDKTDTTETTKPTATDKTDPTTTEKPTPSVTGTTDKTEPTKTEKPATSVTDGTDKTDPTKNTTTGKDKPTTKPTTGKTKPTTKPTTKTEPTKTSSTVAVTLPTAIGGQPIKEMGLNKVSTFCEMTIDELEKHYGQTLIPIWLPEGMEKRLDMPLGVYKKDLTLINENKSIWKNLLDTELARDADVVYDCNQIRWSDFIDGRRELTVGICTAPYPRYKLGDITRFDDPVTVGNTEVMAAYFEDSADCWCWSTLFQKDNVEYYVEGWNITKEEFVHILESLV